MSRLKLEMDLISGPEVSGSQFSEEEKLLMADGWCLGGGKGGGGQTSSNTSTGLPEYAQPYYEDLMNRAQVATTEEYVPFEGQRIADRSADTLSGYDAAKVGMGTGVNANSAAMQGTGGIFDNVMANTPGIQAGMVNSTDINGGNYNVNALTFPGADLSQYMNPYTQEVSDRAMAELQRQNQQSLAGIRASAGQAGAYGGGRHGLLEAEQYGNYNRTAGDLSAQLWSQNFDQARNAIAVDQDRILKGDLANQQIGYGSAAANQEAAMKAQMANQQYGLEGQRLNTEAFLNSNQMGLGALSQYGKLGDAVGAASLQDSSTLRDLGREQELYSQTSLDQDYADFVNQRDYPYQQLNRYSGYLQGLPLGQQSEVYTNPNPWAQALGMGVGGLSLYKMFNGG